MSETIPSYAQNAYAVLFNRFRSRPFAPDYLSWFVSRSMTKKILYTLEKGNWIRRIERGKYVCVKPEEAIEGLVRFRVPKLLEDAEKKYCYSKSSSVEIWTDFSYVQRSFEHSPYFIRVLKEDLKFWVDYFRDHKIKVFIKEPKPALGEFVVLIPKRDFKFVTYHNKPVEPLNETKSFCEKNIQTFEYPLAYLVFKFNLKTKARIDPRVLEEAKKDVGKA